MIKTELELRFVIDITRPITTEERGLVMTALDLTRRARLLRRLPWDDVDAIEAAFPTATDAAPL